MIAMVPRTIYCRAPAKVNLTLAILARRPDGFHEIESWVMPFGWCDRLSLTPSDQLSLQVESQAVDVTADSRNLVWRAAEVMANEAGREPGVAITLEKSIPTGAGLGGGSSDAASTLLGLNQLWELGWPTERLLPLAAEIGSDVPLFLTSGPVIIRGRGERVERLVPRWHGWLAVVVPPYHVSTQAVYQAWDDGARTEMGQLSPWDEPPFDSDSLLYRLFNDLEPAAFAVEPRLRDVHSALERMEGRPVRMTGSGSAFFTIFDQEALAEGWCTGARNLLGPDFEIRVFQPADDDIQQGHFEVEGDGQHEHHRSQSQDGQRWNRATPCLL